MRPPNFRETKIKQDIAVNPLPWIIFHFRKLYKLHRTIYLCKALYKISMISIQCNTIKSYYAKFAMREKKRLNRMLFYKTQEFSETTTFN